MKTKLLLLTFFSTLLLFSCKKDEQTVAIDTSYFPLLTGKYIIYNVDSIYYNDFDEDTEYYHYQIKEEVDSAYLLSNGETAYRILRSQRNDTMSSWNVTDAWSAYIEDNKANKVEENLHFIKLEFPVITGREWYGNIYIQPDSTIPYLADWQYKYVDVNVPYTIGSAAYDSTVDVLQIDDQNAVLRRHFEERYAKNIGMIYQERMNVEYTTADSANYPILVPKGSWVKMSITTHN